MSVLKFFQIFKDHETYGEDERYTIYCRYCQYEERIHRSFPRDKLLKLHESHGMRCKMRPKEIDERIP